MPHPTFTLVSRSCPRNTSASESSAGNQFVKNLMFDGVYSSDFALLSEDILDWFSAINERYASVYSDTEHHRAVKATIDQMYA